jgi:outer membrane receptor protein involved in Fe transport
MLYTNKIRSGLVATVLISAAMLFCCSITVLAQSATGGIRGIVTDATGATLPNATVIAKNLATGVESKTTTTSEGSYSTPRILPGIYTIVVEASGFKKSEVTNVEVSVGKDAVVDFKLEAGAITEVVTVAGGSEALVEKDTVQISTTFSQKKVQELPINIPGRGLDRVALLTPGVTVGFGNVNGNGVTLSANGQRARSNNFTIDGVDNNDLSIGGPNYFVRNPDVVGEYQIITNNFSAEYGRNQGAVINIVSRSGTNGYHGAVGWDHLDQKNFDSLTNLERKVATVDRPQTLNPAPSLDNIFTYGVGGPVIKDKIFFYTTGYFRRNPLLADLRSTTFAPTPAGVAAMKAAFPNNAAIQYYADFSAFSLPLGNPTVRALSPTPLKILLPDGTPVNVQMATVQRLVPRNNRQDEYTVRSDANLSEKHRIWGRYFWQNAPGVDALVGVDGFSGDQPAQSKQIGGGWNWSISTRINNEFRFNYSKLFVLFGGGSTGGKGQIPHPDDIDKALANFTLNFSGADLPGGGLLAVGPATNLPQGRSVEAFQYTDNMTLTYGNHQLKAGFDLRKLENSAPFLPFVNGQFTFNTPGVLATNTPTATNVAFGPATLVYGEYDKFAYFQDDWRIKPNLTLNLGLRYEHTGQPINLLNDVTVARESNNSTAFWRQNLPIEARTNPRIPADNNNFAPRVGFVYSPRFENGFMGKLFGGDRTTIRGGYGVAYDATFYNLLLNISTASPTVFLTSAALPVPSAAPTGDVVRGAAQTSGLIRFNTFDPRLLSRTTINPKMRSPYSQQWSLGIQRELPGNNVFEVRYVGTHGVGLFQTINANPAVSNLVNGFSQEFIGPGASEQKMTFRGFPGALGVSVTPLDCPDIDGTADKEDACKGRIFPTGPARERINGAQNIYHSLQMRYDGRFRSQWNYGFSYTYSKNLDNASEVFSFAGGNSVTVGQNPLQLTGIERAYSGFDVPHSFTANFIWTLPFMKEQKGVLGRIVGGWQLNGTARVQNGVRWTPTQPLGRNPYEDAGFMAPFISTTISHLRPFAGNPNAPRNSVAITDVDACLFYNFCGATNLPRKVNGKDVPVPIPHMRTSPTGFYLMSDLIKTTPVFTAVTPNDARFIINGPGSAARFGTPFGTLSRNTESGDRIETVDLSVFKTFKVTESVNVQYRLQLINALNHPIFALNASNNFIGTPASISLDNVNFYNFQENSGGRRVISMSLRIQF